MNRRLSLAVRIGGGDMEVHHKSKPWHGWREFLKEYAIIVVGVLTALGGEQIVEWLHHQDEVADARQAVRAEIAANAGVALYAIEYNRCLMAFADKYVAWAKSGGPPLGFGEPLGAMRTGAAAWDVVKAGAAEHMPLEERLAYSRFHNSLRRLDTTTDALSSAWLRLGGDAATAVASPADARRVIGDASQARTVDMLQIQFGHDILQEAKAMGLEPAPLSAETHKRLANFCAGTGAALASD